MGLLGYFGFKMLHNMVQDIDRNVAYMAHRPSFHTPTYIPTPRPPTPSSLVEAYDVIFNQAWLEERGRQPDPAWDGVETLFETTERRLREMGLNPPPGWVNPEYREGYGL